MANEPQDVIAELKDGNRRFVEGWSIQSADNSRRKLKELTATGQFPKAIVLCCSDSRAPVELIFDQGIGDLFVIRVAGNIIAPSLVGSVEFAAHHFRTKIVLVMGHSRCGAVRATLDFLESGEPIASDNLHDIISRIRPNIYSVAHTKGLTFEEKMPICVEANVRATVGQLTFSSRIIEDLVRAKKLEVRGAVLHLETGAVEFLEE